jgi:hypothetical protein
VHFSNVSPGDVVVTAPFWYKASLQRGSNAFNEESSAVAGTGDLKQSPYYNLRRVSTVPLGAGAIERTLVLEDLTGPVQLRDVPLPNTFQVQEGSVFLATNEYAFSGGVLSFPTPKSLVTVTYQTSALGAAALTARKDYYTPLLYEVRFEV